MLGLGLAIVKALADLLGLRLALSSTPAKGSCFEIQVPLAHIVPEPIVANQSLPLERLDGLNILIIDDDAEVRRAMCEWLGEQGARVQAAEGSTQALQSVQATALPDVLILDYRLRAETGPQCHRRLVEHAGLNCPVLMVTAERGEVELAGTPKHQLLRKPVLPDKLIKALLELLN